MQFGILLSDVPSAVPAAQQFDDMRRITEAAQRNGFTYIAIGQHFLYGDLRWLQPVPVLARLAADVDPHVRLVTHVMIGPFYHPILLAEEIATLDVVTEGRLIFGVGIGYRPDEFGYFDVPYKQRGPRLDESIDLMRLLWTEDEVTFQGRFWTLDGVRPHIAPVEQPFPPLWIGGHSVPGARRAGRVGDAYLVPPEATVAEIDERFKTVKAGFDLRGKPFGSQPVRRNVLIGKDRDDALREFSRVAKARYVTYAQRGLDVYTPEELEDDFITAAESHALLGSADEVTKKLADLVGRVPVDPIILKPQWPNMSADETIAAIDCLGESVVADLRSVEPVSWAGATQ